MKRTLACSPRSFALAALVAGALLVGHGGCAGSLDPALLSGSGGTGNTVGQAGSGGTGGGGTVCDAPNMVLTPKCGMVGCHSTSSPQVGLDLQSSGVAARLLNQASAGPGNPPCSSNTKAYLVGGSNPAQGFLLDKLMTPAPCGVPMPEIGSLSSSDLTCLNAWATAVTTGAITQ